MLQLSGAALIILSCALLGFYQANQLSNRPRQLRQWIKALQRLETEIDYGFTPLPQALVNICGKEQSPVTLLLVEVAEQLGKRSGVTTAEAWQQAIARHWTASSLKIAEREVLEQLGATLGLSDRSDQIKHIRLALSHLRSEEETAREEQMKYSKMWRSLGILGGTLIVILIY